MITKENYQDLIWDENISFDDYCKFYETLDKSEKIEFIKFLLENYPKYDEEWIEYYFDTSAEWEANGEWGKLADFADFVREKSPDVYQKEFDYLDTSPTLYAFLQENVELGKTRFQQTVNNPEKAIDNTLRQVFNVLSTDRKFYGYLEEVAQKIWQPLAHADNLMGGAEFEYSLFLYAGVMEKAFEKIKNEQAIDWVAFEKEVVDINFKFVEEFKLLPDFAVSFDENKLATNAPYRNEKLNEIGVTFFYSAYTELGIPVYWAFRGWFDWMQYCLGDSDARKRKNWLLFTPTMIDRMGGSLRGMLGSNQSGMMGVVWVVPYIYDHFLNLGYIDEITHFRMMEYYQFTRRACLKMENNTLWKYAGFYTWQKPKFISEEDFAKEKSLVAATVKMTMQEGKDAIQEHIESLPKLPKSATPTVPKQNPLLKKLMNPDMDFNFGESSNKGSGTSSSPFRKKAKKKRKKNKKTHRRKKK